jgi:hypothetical protein
MATVVRDASPLRRFPVMSHYVVLCRPVSLFPRGSRDHGTFASGEFLGRHAVNPRAQRDFGVLAVPHLAPEHTPRAPSNARYRPVAKPGRSRRRSARPAACCAGSPCAARRRAISVYRTSLIGRLGVADPGPGPGFGATHNIVTHSGSGLVFSNTFEASVTSQFMANIITAENDLAALFTDSITLFRLQGSRCRIEWRVGQQQLLRYRCHLFAVENRTAGQIG